MTPPAAVLHPSVSMRRYVRDDFPHPPSLNSGLANLLLTHSAAHVRYNHPRLNPAWTPDDVRDYDLGSAAHGVLLEHRELVVVNYPDYRTKHAQALRVDAKIAGKLPVLAHQAADIGAMVTTARAALAACSDLESIGPLIAEQTICWGDNGARLRCRPDWVSEDWRMILSYKTTKASAEPDSFIRTLLGGGYEVQAAFEITGVKALSGTEPQYVWLVQEVEAPFAVSLLGLSPALAALGAGKYRAAVQLWAHCMARDVWPSYPPRICWLDPPPWAIGNWNERQTMSGANEPDNVEAL